MGWRKILKSSRGEAYEVFLSEFGPEVDLDSLRVSPYDNGKQVQIDSSDSEWTINYDILSSGEELFTFESMVKYQMEGNFVQGMFETECPERYQELLKMAREVLLLSNRTNRPTLTDPLIDKYLESLKKVMLSLKPVIRSYDWSKEKQAVLLFASHHNYIKLKPEAVAQKMNTAGTKKSTILFAITELMVDKMIREVPFLSDKNLDSKVTARSAGRYPNGFRDSLTELYYNLFIVSTAGGEDPHIVFNAAATDSANKLVSYLGDIAEEYMGGIS